MAQCLSADVGEDESSFPQFDISVSTEAAVRPSRHWITVCRGPPAKRHRQPAPERAWQRGWNLFWFRPNGCD